MLFFTRLSARPLAWFVVTFGTISALMYSLTEDDDARFKKWREDLVSPAAERQQDALDRYALGDESWPTDVPCTTIVSMLSTEEPVRDAAVSALARLVAHGECVDATLLTLSNAGDPRARALAAVALGAARRVDRDQIVHELVPLMCGDDSVAIAAIGAVSRLADSSPPTIAALAYMFDRGAPSLRAAAIDPMVRIDPPVGTVPLLAAAVIQRDPPVRDAAMSGLITTDPDPPTRRAILDCVRRLLQDCDAVVRADVRHARRIRDGDATSTPGSRCPSPPAVGRQSHE